MAPYYEEESGTRGTNDGSVYLGRASGISTFSFSKKTEKKRTKE